MTEAAHCLSCGLATTPLPTPETKPMLQTSIYPIGKRDHEEMILVASRTVGIPAVALRFRGTYRGLYPKNEEEVVRNRLAATFRFIVSQRLLPRADKGRVAAIESLKVTQRTREYIEKGKKEGESPWRRADRDTRRR